VQVLIGALVALPVATLLYSVLYYLADVHRLRRFPSPSLAAALSPLWMMWHNARGKKYEALDLAHQQLGPVLRVGPKTLSFSAPEAYKDIYGHGSPILKDIFYDNLANGNPSMGDATDRQLHSIKRKNLSSIFSAKNILSMEPKVTSSVEELLAAIRIKLNGGALSNDDKHVVLEGVFDVQPWLNMFSYDVISKMLWSSSYGFLKCGSDDCNSMAGDGRRMERGDSDDVDFFSFFPIQKTKRCPVPMELPELIAECGTFLNAGKLTRC
ncbi:hypothetical protein CI102_6311, partial [Trichoderma harzianum]